MTGDPGVTAGDIARLAGVGRATVSNWRRRHADFPAPVGGTATSPLFSLADVEDWLRRNGKPFEVSLADRVWQRLRASGDDFQLADLVGWAGVRLLELRGDTAVPSGRRRARPPVEPADAELPALLAELAAERGHADAFDLLVRRYVQAHSRRLDVTREDVARLMARLVCRDGDTVLDPACGLGTLLRAAPDPRSALGQDGSAPAALIAEVRLLLAGTPAEIAAGDSLRRDAFPGAHADAVLCNPPFGDRAWGHGELAGDPRWEYGLPPRGEPELAWAQHCLAHLRPGGRAAVLMPSAVASRRPGRRIRGNLLRAGALRAVITLAAGGPDLWLLRRPEPGRPPPATVLLLDAEGDLELAGRAWERRADGEFTVPVIDLLDDEVDVAPARHRPRQSEEAFGRRFTETLDRLTAAVPAPPDLEPLAERRPPPVTTLAELSRAGVVAISHGPARLPAGGDVPVLTVDDVSAGTGPSGTTAAAPGLIMLEPGDVVATAAGSARVVTSAGAALGPHLTHYRPDPERLDPRFLAGFLTFAHTRTGAGSSRMDLRRARIPRLSLERQRDYGRAFEELARLTATLRDMSSLGETLVGLSFDGLLDGHLRPRR
ncbi:SAM-dependent methyltransferase [Actinomadura spongiicola]|uniref:SAM-dependent methyltransferase n=1 Tax=Actinomadura spongiicola TaxID=2303421 RepID=A0A372GCI2_9ACTN|nr:N-6 DNA methylase [Actinomadura spongiicola]RFS82882.1 SAM-dependent methyltransferase [Actinomadura spongiicola]